MIRQAGRETRFGRIEGTSFTQDQDCDAAKAGTGFVPGADEGEGLESSELVAPGRQGALLEVPNGSVATLERNWLEQDIGCATAGGVPDRLEPARAGQLGLLSDEVEWRSRRSSADRPALPALCEETSNPLGFNVDHTAREIVPSETHAFCRRPQGERPVARTGATRHPPCCPTAVSRPFASRLADVLR